jgi:hypothetical protein
MTHREQEQFDRLVRSLYGWCTIDDIKAKLDREDYWSKQFLTVALDTAKKAKIRQLMRKVKEPDGRKTFASIVQPTPNGELQRVYKQETLFTLDDHYQVINYHVDRATYHMHVAEDHRERALKQHPTVDPTQLQFPWEL